MNIKSEYELAHILGSAFKGYASILQNGNIAAFKGFMTEDTVTVSLRVVQGKLVVSEGPDVDGYIAQVGVLEGKVKTLEKEVKSLTLLLEAQTPEEALELPEDTPELETVYEIERKEEPEKDRIFVSVTPKVTRKKRKRGK